MNKTVSLASLESGQQLHTSTFDVSRQDLIRYAGASGDFNPIHWSDSTAHTVGLPGVIAHGMYTLALVGDAVTAWAGSPAAVTQLGARFTKPVVVPDQGSTTVNVELTVHQIDLDKNTVTVNAKATCDGTTVLAKARATVSASPADRTLTVSTPE